jgi:xylan 1,4-beta-xylosidase
MLPDPVHDESYSAALVAKTIADNDGLVQAYSFWTFSDLFEEMGQFSEPFHGGFGLQTVQGIKKPTYRVFEMLHNLGDKRIKVEGGADATVEILAVKKDASLTLLVYNHNVPGANICAEQVSINLNGAVPSRPILITRIDNESANPKQKWIEIGQPTYPNRTELAQIEQASIPITSELKAEASSDGCTLRFVIPPHGIASINLNF